MERERVQVKARGEKERVKETGGGKAARLVVYFISRQPGPLAMRPAATAN